MPGSVQAPLRIPAHPRRHLHLAHPRHASLIELIKGNREVDVEAALPSEAVDGDDMDQFGSTPLILAAQRDWAFVVGELLRRPGVDPNHQNLFGSTALICAAANGYISTLEELLGDQRVDLEVSTRLGQTALFKAVLFGHMNTTERLPASRCPDQDHQQNGPDALGRGPGATSAPRSKSYSRASARRLPRGLAA